MHADQAAGPWNPGLESTIPEELRPLCTFLRADNAFTTAAQARELRGFTGLDYADLAVLRPWRLALHEVLVRVSADLSVPDGERVEDLGINFRAMTSRILERLEPRRAQVEALYERRRRELGDRIGALLAALSPATAASQAAQWAREGESRGERYERAAARAAARIVSAILVRHGRLWGPGDAMALVATGLACNEAIGAEIGELLEPAFLEAAKAEGYRRLPAQPEPIVMNTKGASASGKTTIRPLQRRLATTIGADWGEFALISPDIWRKQLLDYGSLGAAYKYAGPFTGEELRIVDQKLDLHMAAKAERGEMPHLLIDRFRFDSFAPHSDEAGSNLLTRFGSVVYLFFMITPPAALVQRAWNRGLDVGRYKAVDDTLAHAIEAYSGMPQLFFTWVGRSDKHVHFEFLDNDVPAGARPITAAYGWNDELVVLDPEPLRNIERFRRIDVNARSPDALFTPEAAGDAGGDGGLLAECVRRLRRVRFVDRTTRRVHRLVEGAREQAVDEPLARDDRRHTVGRWSAEEA